MKKFNNELPCSYTSRWEGKAWNNGPSSSDVAIPGLVVAAVAALLTCDIEEKQWIKDSCK